MSRVTLAEVKIEPGWKRVLAEQFTAAYFVAIKDALLAAKREGKIIFPPGKLIFNAFDRSPFERVKVVIIGQDPYHGAGQAMGLSFSVPPGIRVPPSLQNIYKELQREYPDFRMPDHGDLSYWAQQGVLLLNASLTVEAGRAGSHRALGWQHFTDAAICALNREREGIVFLLWGAFAKAKAGLIERGRHCVLTAVHPSPLAGNRFLGCDHFRRANVYLTSRGETAIDWQV